MSVLRTAALVAVACAAALVAGCERETRGFEGPAAGARVGSSGTPSMRVNYDDNAFAIGQGKRLFDWYNCSGCHSHGGGGMGPALMDDVWIYGSDPDTIYQTITQGRPNGMPSFGNRIPEDQIWQLVSYVRSMSGLTPKNASPSRNDTMQDKPAENRMTMPHPVRATPPQGRQ